MALEVAPDVGRRVLVDGEGSGGVADEDVGDADIDIRQRGDLAGDLIRHQVEAPGPGGQGDLLLYPPHQSTYRFRNRSTSS